MPHPIVEAWSLDPDDPQFQPTPEEMDAHLRCNAADKTNPTDEHLQIAATVTDECRELAASCKRKRKLIEYARRGHSWYTRIVDDETGETLFESPNVYGARRYALRHGERIIKRWRKTGKFEKPPAIQLPAKFTAHEG